MFRNIIAPILLLITGLFSLFPKTLAPFISWGFEPVTIQTAIGLISVLLAIGLLSSWKVNGNHKND